MSELIDTRKLEKILNIEIKQEELYEIAFTHRSYLNEHPEYNRPSNERMEFLGDAVLQLLSSNFLYTKYEDSNEGDLTNYRAAIVCTKSIGAEAMRLGYGEFLLLSKGEDSTGGREREYILANTFEAVLGAMFLEHGLDTCRAFVERELLYKVEEIVENEQYKDAKSKFQELAQEKKSVTPTYEVLKAWGADHEKMFEVAAKIENEIFGIGEGRSKQKAEQKAAKNALDKLKTL